MTQQPWIDKVSNSAQIGGIETAVLDNGPGRGTRIAWINTGTGLRFKVVIDRAMDIADAFYNQHSLAWLSHSGITPPQAFPDQGVNWLRTFNGGLLTTCGLTHVGGPEQDAYGERGLHGLIGNIPAEIESIIQPDPATGNLEMSITGRMRETTVFGPSLELKRTISATLGQPTIRIHDEVVNRANTPAPHMLLYHFNFGWPLVDEGTQLIWQGGWQAREGGMNGDIFREGYDFKTCPAPLEQHSGTGEAVAFIDASPDQSGQCSAGLYNARLGLAVALRFQKEQLPWLTNWQHWGRGEYVTGIEPGTHPPIGQAKAREQQTLIMLQPGERRTYDVALDVLTTDEPINQFLTFSA
ncbi:aldose 1-epimerase family protein [Spirosoma utsteinense]|uniref:Galactose mutarotase-like enzyme n=1 Tax=Spirosoma utsteinense TaxID=2585773 RepID=A0ABR6WA25_9BACT|nr:aldose 1-epimerase family protein [Spirosoma utsteinense]MBC3787002.1 galactose mutarotase-like enzyme [Spirosoma utsteinense]MBC3793417.1 galactose mutarotase-like enzyme [Spirosoma utsteinense]